MTTIPDRRNVDRVMILLNKYGAATLIACFVVWWITTDVSTTLRASRSDTAALKTLVETHATETAIYLRQICLNTSSTPQQAIGCSAQIR